MTPRASVRAPRVALTLAVALATLLLLAGPQAAAQAAGSPSPAWAIDSVGHPTNFQPGDTVNDTWQVTVVGTGGTFRLYTDPAGVIQETSPIAYEASAATVQQALENLSNIGTGNVTVSGGPTATGASYEIQFVGDLQGVYGGLSTEGSELTGTSAGITANEVAQPQVVDNYLVTVTNVGGAASDGSQITLTDYLPAGVTTAGGGVPGSVTGDFSCSTGAGLSVIVCTSTATVPPATPLDSISIPVAVAPGTTGPLVNRVTVSGGGAATSSTSDSNPVGAQTTPFSVLNFQAEALDPSGQPDTQAGDHPSALTTTIDLPTKAGVNFNGVFQSEAVENLRQVSIDLPAGLIGDPQSAPTCTLAELTNTQFGQGCPAASQVGTLWVVGEATGVFPPAQIYNITPEHGYPAEFGVVVDVPVARTVLLYASVVGTGADTHLRVTTGPLPQAVKTTGLVTTFFGNPANQDGSPLSPIAFASNPTNCNARGFTTTVHVDSWQNPGRLLADGQPDFSDPNWKSATAQAPPVTGCDQLSFSPTLGIQPDATTPDSPTGLSVDLGVPQTSDPGDLATPELKDATVTLPEGVTVSPSSANGLQSCSDAQIDVASNDPGSCPLASQIGTLSLTTPLLDHPLPGQIYLGTPLCNPCTNTDAQDGNMLRLFLQINDPVSGTVIKIPGTVRANPATGQLVATFQNNPQLPFSDLQLQFKGGPTGVLSTPSTCGTFTATSDLSSWASPFIPDATPSSSFAISGCGPARFSPTFAAGSQNPQAGAYSPFAVTFTRSDSDQFFSGLRTVLPDGLLAKLAGVPLCSDADASAGTCPASSQVGTVETGAGPGSEPFFLPGKAFLTGPYKGAPYGLDVVVPAIAGPFNLGTVVVRQALYVNPTTAQVTDVSDPFPTILDGIPLQIRRIDVVLNRPGFTVNPTSCDVMAVTGTLTSTGGMSSDVSSRFQVGGCAALPFKPKLKMALTGKGQTRSGDHPTLTSILTQPAGEANIHNVRVALPLNFALDPNNSQNVCSYSIASAVHGGAVNCPASTIVGHATAVTPLLSQPLSGNVYLVQGLSFKDGVETHTLPTLLIPLRGQIALDLRAQTSVSHNKLVTTFPTIPDAAVSKFTLTINGGKKGILVITGRGRSICGKPQVTDATLVAQSGKADYPDVKMSTPCRAPRKHHKHKK